MTNTDAGNKTKKPKQSLWQIVTSTCAAAFGVQTEHNRQRDFAQGNIKTYIISGIIFTLVFIGVIAFVVKLVLSNAGV